MLAVLECNAAYVPLDAGFPPDRIAHIVSDSGARIAVIPSHLRELIPDEVGAVEVDTGSDALGIRPGWPAVLRRGRDPDGRAGYLIYTSGTPGRPKGCGGRALGDLQLRPGRGRALRITSGSGSCSAPEDGTVKSDRTEIGDGATVGVPAFVHYGVTMGEGSCWTRTRS